MEIIVIPPEMGKIDIKMDLAGTVERRIYCGDIFFQEKDVKAFFGEDSHLFGVDDLGGDCVYSGVNEYTIKFAREWFLDKSIKNVFDFKGANLAAQLIIAYTYYFIKVLKAVDSAAVLFQAHYSDTFFLIDDKSVWARAFKYIASEKNIKVNIIPAKNAKEKMSIVESRQLAESSKSFRDRLSILTKFNIKTSLGNNVLYSSALRFAEPLWEVLGKGKNNFFLRPDFSIKDYAACLNSKYNVKYLTTGTILTAKDEKECLSWCAGNDIWNFLERKQPEIDKFFDYKGISIWALVKEDLIFMVESSILEGAKRVVFSEKLFERIDPEIVIVEESTCPFNKILVDIARKKGIPVVELLHGLLTMNGLSGMGRSSFIAVPGEYARYKLREWGIEDAKIKVTGAPHYQAKIPKLNKSKVRNKIRTSLKIPPKGKLITVITNPFFSERNPYFVGSPLTPQNTVRVIETVARFVEENQDAFAAIKIHPMDTDSWLIEDIIEKKGLNKKIRILSDANTLELLGSSDLVLSGGSTVYLEALLVKVPVLIFDDAVRPFWQDLRAEVIDLSDTDKCLRSIKEVLFSDVFRQKRLEKQEREKKWHFIEENKNSLKEFRDLIETEKIKPGILREITSL